jgi:hypothetical protein
MESFWTARPTLMSVDCSLANISKAMAVRSSKEVGWSILWIFILKRLPMDFVSVEFDGVGGIKQEGAGEPAEAVSQAPKDLRLVCTHLAVPICPSHMDDWHPELGVHQTFKQSAEFDGHLPIFGGAVLPVSWTFLIGNMQLGDTTSSKAID